MPRDVARVVWRVPGVAVQKLTNQAVQPVFKADHTVLRCSRNVDNDVLLLRIERKFEIRGEPPRGVTVDNPLRSCV